MLALPRADLAPNTAAFETNPLVKATGFREYDARWLFGPEINLLGVEALGLGLGTYFHELGKRRVVVGHDYRSYSLSIKQALSLGLVSAVVAPEALEAEGEAMVADMLHATPLGLRLTKECLNHSIDAGGLEAAIAMEDRNQILCAQGEDFREGVAAFLEKRPAQFTGE